MIFFSVCGTRIFCLCILLILPMHTNNTYQVSDSSSTDEELSEVENEAPVHSVSFESPLRMRIDDSEDTEDDESTEDDERMNADDSESSEDDVQPVVPFANVLAIDEQLERTVRSAKRLAKRNYNSCIRKAAPTVDELVAEKYKKIKKHVNKSHIQLSCCSIGCLVDVEFAHVDIYKNHKILLDMKQSERRVWLASVVGFGKGNMLPLGRGCGGFNADMEPTEVCKDCFCAFYGPSKATVNRVVAQVNLGQLNFDHGNLGRKRKHSVVDLMGPWVEGYANRTGDFMPDARSKKKTCIHLPDYKWRNVHNKLVKFYAVNEQVPLEYNTLLRKSGF